MNPSRDPCDFASFVYAQDRQGRPRGSGGAPEVCAIIRPMLEERDIERLIQVFATRADRQAAVSNLATKDDSNELLNSMDAYANKAGVFSGKGDAFS